MAFSNWKDKIRRQLFKGNERQKPKNLEEKLQTSVYQSQQETDPAKGNSVDIDGTIMLFPTNQKGSQFVLGNKDPNHLKDFSTDSHNRFIMKKESNIQFWNVFSGDITYKSTGKSGKSCRLNMFASTNKQINDWKSALKMGYIGNEHDLKNQEVTIVMRLRKRVGHKTECCIKMRGGGHHGDRPDQAACIELGVSTRDSGHSARWAKELIHPSYEYQELEPFFEFFVEEEKWFGMKTTSWNNKDNTTTNRCYIDPEPIDTNGTMQNNYSLYSEHIDEGNGAKYQEIVSWAGGVPTTVRADGFESVDFYVCNAREIIPPLR